MNELTMSNKMFQCY